MYIFWMLLVGLVVGMGARLFLHTRGYATPITLGLAGSCIAGFLGHAAGWFRGPANVAGITISVFGAIFAVVAYGVVSRRRAGRARQGAAGRGRTRRHTRERQPMATSRPCAGPSPSSSSCCDLWGCAQRIR